MAQPVLSVSAGLPSSGGSLVTPVAGSANSAKLGVIRLDAEYKHASALTVQELFSTAGVALGRSDFTQPCKVLASHMVETVGDLRLLVVENQLREIGLPIRLCVWIEEEIAKLAAPVGGVSVTVPTTAPPALPPIPLSAPVPPRPSPATVVPFPSGSGVGLVSPPDKVAIFSYRQDFDEAGLLYYLGTKGGSESWRNPMDQGHVTVTSSGVNKDSAPLSAIVGRETVRCVTNSSDASYVQVDVHNFFCRPTNYSLKHYLSYDSECLRHWKLEGSVDGQTWVLLKEHQNDTNLNTKGGTCTWNIQPDEPRNYNQTPSVPNSPSSALAPHLLTPSLALSSPKHWYRCFRVTMLGPNSNNHLYLACSGFELYGYVLSQAQMTAWTSAGGSVAAIPTWMTANYPPWLLPKDGVLNIQQNLHTLKGAAAGKPIDEEEVNDTLNGLDDGDEDDYKVPSSLAILAGQLSNLSFVDGVPKDAVVKAAANGLAATAAAGGSGASGANDFKYQSDFDRNGMVWALATQNGAAPWVNPVEAGLLTITASSLMEDSTSLAAICGRDTVRCVTKPLANSWILLDFHADKRLLLTHYTFKHYSSWDSECVRCWRMEASVSGDLANPAEWFLLREHTNDENLNGKGGTFTWSLSGGDINNVLRHQTPWRFLRITQTGENSNKHLYLALSGIELYGRLLQPDGVTPYAFGKPNANASAIAPANGVDAGVSAAAAAASASGSHLSSRLRTFKYQSNFDTNGILYWLATSGGQSAWRSPADAGLVQLSCSTLSDDSEPLSAIVGQRVVRCVSQPIPDQWFAVDFGPTKLVQPTAYTLRHYSSWDTEALRNWRFEGTTDANPHQAAWVRISEHKEDTGLEGKGAAYTWPVQTTRFFRQFRIYQFDKNSNKHHYLALSGFELYGTVKLDASAPSGSEFASIAGVASQQQLPTPLAALPISAPLPLPPVAMGAPVGDAASASSSSVLQDVWDPDAKGAHLVVLPSNPTIVRNNGSADKWQLARGRVAYAGGLKSASVRIVEDPNTSNTWRFIIGLVPTSLDCKGAKQWVGTSNSWGYISGTGGKCHNTAVSATYGSKYTQGDVVTIHMNFATSMLGFFRNDEFQGTAFMDLAGPVHVAASLTATDSALQLVATPASVLAKIAQMGQHMIAPVSLAPVLQSPQFLTAWDPSNKSTSLVIDAPTGLLRNTNSNDKWQSCRSLKPFSAAGGARQRFDIELVDCPKTNNSWQVIVGVVPPSFTCVGNKQWVGAGESWGYIGGTGGICHNQPKSAEYGAKFGAPHDTITVVLDFAAGTIEFMKNGVAQGVAFTNLAGTVYAAVSLTATGATARLQIHP